MVVDCAQTGAASRTATAHTTNPLMHFMISPSRTHEVSLQKGPLSPQTRQADTRQIINGALGLRRRKSYRRYTVTSWLSPLLLVIEDRSSAVAEIPVPTSP